MLPLKGLVCRTTLYLALIFPVENSLWDRFWCNTYQLDIALGVTTVTALILFLTYLS